MLPAGYFSATNRANILLIDGDRNFCDAATDCLTASGYHVQVVHCGVDALDKARARSWHAIVLNVTLPDFHDLNLLRTLRQTSGRTPILVVTDRADEADEVATLESGADDYLPKGGSDRQLLARLHAVIRRGVGVPSLQIIIAELRIMPEAGLVTRDGRTVPLTPGEFAILWSLARTPGRAKTRSHLFSELRHRQQETSYRVLDTQVASLRRKLGDDPRRPRFIHTVHRVGYVLVHPLG